ncbi:NUDIX domain-containing protein [Clostridium beijerinckii]|uniref:NUDIX domain-containing protein n=1 Tax=Clostridium beijerinckii TaxID=1520 RepID=UPI000AAFB1B3|nr:NUDIX domain-containing protein [Clostridium beijerinckii]
MDEYIKKLRKHIGNEPLLLVAAGAIIYKNRKTLLQRRADSGNWAIHGGVLELGETVEETYLNLILDMKKEGYKMFALYVDKEVVAVAG